MSNPLVWWLCLPYVLYIVCGYAVVLWTPLVVRSLLQLSDQGVGLVTGVIGLVGCATMWVSGALSDWRNERIIHGQSHWGRLHLDC